jgi:hypothetical protein
MKVHEWRQLTQRKVSENGSSLTARVPECKGSEAGANVGGGEGRGGAAGANDGVTMLDVLLVMLHASDLSAA